MLAPRDKVIRSILRGLYEGKYEPGQRLIEANITEEMDVSRGPVREAFNRLDAMGVIELLPQRGARIRVLGLQDAIDTLVVVQALVGVAARLATERADDEGRARLRAAIAALASYDPTTSSADYARARDGFYATLSQIAGNAALGRAMLNVHIHLIRVQFRSVLHSVGHARHTDYKDIAQAVEEGEAARAERLARQHVGRSIRAMQKVASQKVD